jgi:hypothetical protein
MDSGKEQRRQKQLYAKYDVKLQYNVLTTVEIQVLWNFYTARQGTFEAFYFYTLEVADWDNLYVGVGDGTSVTFDLPGKSTSSVTVYVDGYTVATYTKLVGGGAESSDRITFVTAPSAGQIITCDLTGYLRIRCRFKEDYFSRNNFEYVLYKSGIELKGLTTV